VEPARSGRSPPAAFGLAGAHNTVIATVKHLPLRPIPIAVCMLYLVVWAYSVWHYHTSVSHDDILIFLFMIGMPANLVWMYVVGLADVNPGGVAQEVLMLVFGGAQYWLLGMLCEKFNPIRRWRY
jgi:hypothetical protein